MKQIQFLAVIIFILFLSGCSFLDSFITDSRIYVAITVTDTRHIPDTNTFSCTVVPYPTDFTKIENELGTYYPVAADTYRVEYAYAADGISYQWDFTVAGSDVTLGKENVYYDLYLHKDNGPSLYRFPDVTPVQQYD